MRDSIFGMVYMHSKQLCHRDIKPENIMQMMDKTFALADYGEGINLNDIYKQSSDLDKSPHIGAFDPAGSKLFMAPKVYEQYVYWDNHDLTKSEKIICDIFKTDIFSLGITFWLMLTLDLKYIKRYRYKEVKIHERLF